MNGKLSRGDDEPTKLKGPALWFMIALHLLLIPIWSLNKDGVVLSIVLLTCELLTFFLRRRTVTWVWVLSPSLGTGADPNTSGKVRDSQERPWFPILLLQIIFGFLPIVGGLLNGDFIGVARYTALLCVILLVSICIVDFFKRIRF